MKKLAIGCAVLVALGAAGAAGASYFAYRKVSGTFAGFVELGSVPELERSIRRQGAYSPPASGEPTRAQVEGLLKVQQAVRASMGSRFDDLYHRYQPYFEPADGGTPWEGGSVDTALVTIRLYRDLAGVYVDGKRAQVDALNRAGLSLAEYRWTRSQVYGALGLQLRELDVARFISNVTAGGESAAAVDWIAGDTTPSPAVRKLVEPHAKAFKQNVILAFFGL